MPRARVLKLCNLAAAPNPHQLSHRKTRTNFLKFLRHRSMVLANPGTALAAVTRVEYKQTESDGNHDPRRKERSSEMVLSLQLHKQDIN